MIASTITVRSVAALFGAALFASVLPGPDSTINAYAQEHKPASDSIPANVAEFLKRANVGRKDIALYAQAVDSSEPLISVNAQESFVLASTAKLITTISALELLGPAYRWQTTAYLSAPLRDGRVNGDLVLVGGGDPLLTDQQLLSWFGKMQKKGLREIGGNIIIDRRVFRLSTKDLSNTPKPSWENIHHAYPDAFLINEGQLEVTLRNGPGGLEASLRPELASVKLEAQIHLSPVPCSDRKKLITATWREADSTIALTGDWSKDCNPQSVTIAPWTHTELGAQTIAMLWRKAGGVLEGSVIERAPPAPQKIPNGLLRAPANKIWMTLDSAPLADVIKQINKWSNNVVSRQVFLSLSHEFPKRAANIESAQESLQNWLSARGLNSAEIKLDNGSGLSRDERGHALVLARLLVEIWSSKIGRALVDSMSIVGVDGTMGGRLKSSPVAGSAFIKTGSLNAVRAIAGYVQSRSGKNYAIVANVNHDDARRAQAAIDAFIEWVYLNG